ncbi:hypothetical protein K491DRAFT_784254 [Lophiostoma macrostomum CBS 122681]|uniref:Zinc finger PHD-type domain-containing protein n=1 Tax=Lophiostoma macrostomum CBS 122681 TaxID=1314788 RepID=A0A6A6SKB2_9PLEO|nr:hypothetical protein K491DRAFT_784254 [Lophiostoma macrostomum CBS 122681]
MVSRKRARDEMEADEPTQEPSTLHKLRNMWQFANVAQYLHLFLDALKFDKDFDIEDLETECLKPQPSEKLLQIGLALLKHVSSFKGLTPENFDEYARRQYVAKAPQRNPFGTDETPNKFDDFDVFTKVRILQQLSLWTLNSPMSVRERFALNEAEQTSWRIEPLGWDREDRALIVLDDNRLYRQTDPPPPPSAKPKPKAKAKKAKGTRASKRRKTTDSIMEDGDDAEEEPEVEQPKDEDDDGLGGVKWECLCVTLEEYQDFINTLRRSKDADEKILYRRLEEDVLPVIEGAAEEKAKKEARRLREAEALTKLATAKRSSRISAKLDKQKEIDEAEEAERKRKADLAMAKAEEAKRNKLEEERESRMMTREQRQREREAKRILEEEELRRLKENSEKLDANEARLSERHLRNEMKRREQELRKLSEEDEWVFDCEKCGVHGENLDDGSHSIACEKCNVWQHSKCHGITVAKAERDDFHFVCNSCKRKEEGAGQPKLPPLRFRLTSTSPSSRKETQPSASSSHGFPRRLDSVQIPASSSAAQPTPRIASQPLLNGPSLSPRGQAKGPPGIQGSEAYGSPYHTNGSSPTSARPYSAGLPHGLSTANGLPTSSPPQYKGLPPPIPHNAQASTLQQANWSPFSGPTLPRVHQSPYNASFSRPASSAGQAATYQSPVKHSPAPSPKPANGVPNSYNFTNSPHSSFPPISTPQTSFSPTKHSSPPPPQPPISSPMSITPRNGYAPVQAPVQMLPNPIPAPSKHDGARPISSHSMSETPIFPPVKALSPNAKPQIMSPPVKKSSPTPERPHFAPMTGNSTNNGFGSSQ